MPGERLVPVLAVIGDVHAYWRHLDPVLARIAEVGVDGILLVGDLGSADLHAVTARTPARDARYLASVAEVLERCGALGPPVAYVPGNHDLPGLALPGNVDHGVDVVGGLRVAGFGGAGPGRFGFAYEWDEEQTRNRPLPACDVMLCHCPPSRTSLDLVPRRGEHVGSEAIREKALAHTGFLVCGHIHESPGAVQLGNCLCMNVGGLGRPFGKPQVGFLLRDGAGDAAWHEDLATGAVQEWTRAAPSTAARGTPG